MKLKKFIPLLTLALCLTSCSFTFQKISSSTSDSQTTSSSSNDNDSSSTSSTHDDSGTISYEGKRADKIKVNFTAINDFHGAIKSEGYQPGLAKVAGYLKNKKQQGNILINAGDMWQGTYESNYSNGKLVTEVFKDIGFDAEVLGNHEFDWGLDRIRENQTVKGSNYLCANIYTYNESGNPSYLGEKYNLCDDYAVTTLNINTENEVRVGMIGVIGKDQFSSIQSTYTKDIIFKDPTPVVQELSTHLRSKMNCDIVVAIYHAPQDVVDPVISSSKYVDAVFCAHTHARESSLINGIPFVQSYCNGQYASNISLVVDTNTKEVTYEQPTIDNWDSSFKSEGDTLKCNDNILNSSVAEDVTTKNLINSYLNEMEASDYKVGSITSQFNASGNLANAVAYGMYQLAGSNGVSVDFSITNQARNNISQGDVNYSDVVTAVPFDNEIIIMKTNGSVIQNQLKYSYVYKGNDSIKYNSIVSTKEYTVAVSSYSAYHIKVNDDTYEKSYNYFTYQKDAYSLKDKTTGETLYYRAGLMKLFADATNNTLNPSDYTNSSNSNFYS